MDLSAPATKSDIAETRADLLHDIVDTRADLIQAKADLLQSLADAKADILKWTIGVILAAVAINTVIVIGAMLALMRVDGH
jgi:hypothetical protein